LGTFEKGIPLLVSAKAPQTLFGLPSKITIEHFGLLLSRELFVSFSPEAKY